jgi:hypothetical protein
MTMLNVIAKREEKQLLKILLCMREEGVSIIGK